jgi:DNA-binding transcriptional regulator YbjK
MNKSKITKGRAKQKLQTRSEILIAAKGLMQKKERITLEDVAKKANISRATMYRYFSNIDLLFTEASLDIHHKSPDQISEDVKNMDFADRIFYIQKHFNQTAMKNEIGFRRYLSAVLSESVVSKKQLRGARRMKSLNKVLEPYKEKFSKDTIKKLISVSSVLMGIDSIIVCKDICKLNNNETENTLKWAIEMILKGIEQENHSI